MRKLLTLVAVIAGAFALPATVSANHTAATAHFIPVGGAVYAFVDVTGSGGETLWFAVNLEKGRSYDASVFSVWTDADADPPVELEWRTADGTSVPPAGVYTADSEPRLSGAAHTGDNDVFIPTASGTYTIRVSNSSATLSGFVIVGLTETTLFSPYWQTFLAAGYDAAPQFKNNTADTITVFFTAYDPGGTPIAGCPTSGIILPPNGMITFGVSSMCSITSGYGGAQVAHTGRLGAISANVTTFSGTSGLSFDAPFETRAGMPQTPVWY